MKCSAKLTLVALGISTIVYWGGTANSLAVDNNPGKGDGISIGIDSSAPKAENVVVGKNAKISYSNGNDKNATGDIAVGNGAFINNYASQGGSIAIGNNAKIENMAGGGEASFAFGQTKFSGSIFSTSRIPEDPSKVVASVAIGDNTFARTGSTMIGSHNYKGEIGDISVDTNSTRATNLGVYTTTIGANSFTNAFLATSTGAFNVMSSEYTGGRISNPQKNLGATITGSLNSIESQTGGYHSGIANAITGVANRTYNSNGALIFGAGNEITNSYASLWSIPSSSGESAKAFAETLREKISQNEGAGATLAIGGGNKADYTQKTSIIGANNRVTGTRDNVSIYNYVTGFKNTATNVRHATMIGAENTISETKGVVLIGDKRILTSADGSIVMGSSENGTTTNVKNIVAIGTESNATVEGGVAIGANSVATTDKDVTGFDLKTGAASTETSSTWKSTAAAVSVGDVANGITRQITNVAAGLEDTDAVNVAQLKKAVTSVPAVVKDGKVEKDNTGIVTGGTVYDETRVSKDGNYVKASNTAGQNLTTLDTQIKQNTDVINNVNNQVTNLDIRINTLDTRIEKVGAGAAALAALHPQDFDSNDKWDFVAGYGHYRSANAVALGAFYRPNEKSMFSVGGSLGGSDKMLNVGVSLKFGESSPYSGYTKAQLVNVIESQQQRLDAQDQKIAEIMRQLEALTK